MSHPYGIDAKLADKYIEGTIAQGWMQEYLDSLFNLDYEKDQNAEVSGDHYDWSLEIDLTGVDYKTFVLTKEAVTTILGWGVKHFWINFKDSDNRYKDDEGREHFRCNAEIYVSKHSRTLKVFSDNGTTYQLSDI